MEAIETLEHAGYTIHIYQDTDAQSPDEWGSEDVFLITTRNRYFEVERKGFTMDGCRDGEYNEDYHVLILNAYIHSGVALSLGREYPFNDQWDSRQIGYVLVKKRCGFRNIYKAAESLVSEWNQYLSGDVYGYVVEGADDSCWGFYGMKYCIEEAKSAAEAARKHETELEAQRAVAICI
jgi:predicted nucleic-acid-binding Zn-ribbon protein